MSTGKLILNVLGIIFSVLLCPIAIASLLAVPFISMGTTFFQQDSFHGLIRDMELSTLMADAFEYPASTETSDIPTEFLDFSKAFIDDLLYSDLMEDAFLLFTDKCLETLYQDDLVTVSKDEIRSLIDKHMPDIVSIMQSNLPDDLPVSENELQTYALNYVEPFLTSGFSNIPDLKEYIKNPTVIDIIRMLKNGTVMNYSLLITVIISITIFLLRFPRFKGFIWLGVTYLFAFLFIFLMYINVDTTIIDMVSSITRTPAPTYCTPIINFVKEPFRVSMRNTGILSISFIMVFILGRLILSRFKKH